MEATNVSCDMSVVDVETGNGCGDKFEEQVFLKVPHCSLLA